MKHNIHNKVNILDNSIKIAYNEIFSEKIYSRHFKVEPNDVVVDFGSHIGLFMIDSIEKGAKIIYCFEPYIPNYKEILKNISEATKINHNSYKIF